MNTPTSQFQSNTKHSADNLIGWNQPAMPSAADRLSSRITVDFMESWLIQEFSMQPRAASE
jgi:hypothetical protein